MNHFYHCMFTFGRQVRVFHLFESSLPERIIRMADVILIDPDPSKFVKDRYGLSQPTVISSIKDVEDYIKELLQHAAEVLSATGLYK